MLPIPGLGVTSAPKVPPPPPLPKKPTAAMTGKLPIPGLGVTSAPMVPKATGTALLPRRRRSSDEKGKPMRRKPLLANSTLTQAFQRSAVPIFTEQRARTSEATQPSTSATSEVQRPPVMMLNSDCGVTLSSAQHNEIQALTRRICTTDYEKYQLFEERDRILAKARADAQDLSNVRRKKIGFCREMCTEKERYKRIVQKRIDPWECDENGVFRPSIAVKEYARSAADQEEPLPHELRPIETLEVTLDYLFTAVADRQPEEREQLSAWYNFLWDRTRAVRKDVTQQQLSTPRAVALIEKCARLHIHASFALNHLSAGELDQKLNTENLAKCLQTLRHQWEDLAKEGIHVESESEFRAYDVLLHLEDAYTFRQALSWRPDVRASLPVRRALRLASAFHNSNWVRFFAILRSPDASYLEASLAARFIGRVRFDALSVMCRAGKREQPVAAENLARHLGFDTVEEAITFCELCGLPVTEDGSILLIRDDLRQPDDESVVPARPRWIFDKIEGQQLSEVLSGNVVQRPALPAVSNSFDPISNAYSNDPVLGLYRLRDKTNDEDAARARALAAQQQRREAALEAERKIRLQAEQEQQQTLADADASRASRSPSREPPANRQPDAKTRPLFSSLFKPSPFGTASKPFGSATANSTSQPSQPSSSQFSFTKPAAESTQSQPSQFAFSRPPQQQVPAEKSSSVSASLSSFIKKPAVVPGGIPTNDQPVPALFAPTPAPSQPKPPTFAPPIQAPVVKPPSPPKVDPAKVENLTERLWNSIASALLLSTIRRELTTTLETEKAATKERRKAVSKHVLTQWSWMERNVVDGLQKRIAKEIYDARKDEESRRHIIARGISRRLHSQWLRQFVERWRQRVQIGKRFRQQVQELALNYGAEHYNIDAGALEFWTVSGRSTETGNFDQLPIWFDAARNFRLAKLVSVRVNRLMRASIEQWRGFVAQKRREREIFEVYGADWSPLDLAEKMEDQMRGVARKRRTRSGGLLQDEDASESPEKRARKSLAEGSPYHWNSATEAEIWDRGVPPHLAHITTPQELDDARRDLRRAWLLDADDQEDLEPARKAISTALNAEQNDKRRESTTSTGALRSLQSEARRLVDNIERYTQGLTRWLSTSQLD